MIKIALFCFAGMSTSILVEKMKEAARKKGLNVSINAYPESEVRNIASKIDIALLGPQVRHYLKRIERICEPYNVKVLPINPVDYGRMDGENVLNECLQLIDAREK